MRFVLVLSSMVACSGDGKAVVVTTYGGGEVRIMIANDADPTDVQELVVPGIPLEALLTHASGGAGAYLESSKDGAGVVADDQAAELVLCGMDVGDLFVNLQYDPQQLATGAAEILLDGEAARLGQQAAPDADEVVRDVLVSVDGEVSGSAAFSVTLACPEGPAPFAVEYSWAFDPNVSLSYETQSFDIHDWF